MSQLEINNTQVQPFYSSLQNFSNLMQREENICSKHFSPGDLVIFDNRRILHARTPFTKMGKRVLRGCYIDYDDFHARFREILSNIWNQLFSTWIIKPLTTYHCYYQVPNWPTNAPLFGRTQGRVSFSSKFVVDGDSLQTIKHSQILENSFWVETQPNEIS